MKIVDLELPTVHSGISRATQKDSYGISKLLNEWFESNASKAKVSITADIVETSILKGDIWCIFKDSGQSAELRHKVPLKWSTLGSNSVSIPNTDSGGTIRGTVCCSNTVIDWFCVHPLWRSKGIGSRLLGQLDYITYNLGRRGIVFLKEGFPLPGFHMPIYGTYWRCRKAGSLNKPKKPFEYYTRNFHVKCSKTGLPLIRVEGPSSNTIEAWENSLDNDLEPCIVFVTAADHIDSRRGWVIDSAVWMYAFRWTPGKFLGTRPSHLIL